MKICKKYCNKCDAETDRSKNGKCKPCTKLNNKIYHAENKERAKITKAIWAANNPEKVKLIAAKWRLKNKGKIKARSALYLKNNKEKIKESSKKWREENKEKQKELQTVWREKNKDRVCLSRKAHYLINKDHVNAVNAKWREDNIEYVRSFKRINEQNRRARKRENGGVLSKGLTERLFKLQRGKCACCKQPLGDDYHLDHIMPIALGGVNEDWNMQLLASFCNIQKHAKHPIEFMQSKGFLL